MATTIDTRERIIVPGPAGFHPPSLNRSQMGAKSYDFQRDGLAHYGMLPDFMQAVSQKPGSKPAISALYHTAGPGTPRHRNPARPGMVTAEYEADGLA